MPKSIKRTPKPEWQQGDDLRLEMGDDMEPEIPPLARQIILRRRAFRDLVQSETWGYIKDAFGHQFTSHWGAAPTTKLDGVFGYLVSKYIGDAFTQALAFIESEARLAENHKDIKLGG